VRNELNRSSVDKTQIISHPGIRHDETPLDSVAIHPRWKLKLVPTPLDKQVKRSSLSYRDHLDV
jgi:hypothetical protein